jgi:hypothetical protein
MHASTISLVLSLIVLYILLSILCSNIIERPNHRWEDNIKNGLRGIGFGVCGMYSSTLG